MIAISIVVTIPVYDYPAVGNAEIFLDVFANKAWPAWLNAPNVGFSDEGKRRSLLRFTFTGLMGGKIGASQTASIRLFIPLGSSCDERAYKSQMSDRTATPPAAPLAPLNDQLGRVRAAYPLKFRSTNLPVTVECQTLFAVSEPSFATRRITVARLGPGSPWSGFSKAPSLDIQLLASAIDQLTIDTNGDREFSLPGLVHLSLAPRDSLQRFATYEWSDDRAQKLANVRVWIGAGLVGLGMSALLEGMRPVLDGRPPRRKKRSKVPASARERGPL